MCRSISDTYSKVQFSIQEQLLRRNVQRFRGGLVFSAHRLLYRSNQGLRVIKRRTPSRLQSRVTASRRGAAPNRRDAHRGTGPAGCRVLEVKRIDTNLTFLDVPLKVQRIDTNLILFDVLVHKTAFPFTRNSYNFGPCPKRESPIGVQGPTLHSTGPVLLQFLKLIQFLTMPLGIGRMERALQESQVLPYRTGAPTNHLK